MTRSLFTAAATVLLVAACSQAAPTDTPPGAQSSPGSTSTATGVPESTDTGQSPATSADPSASSASPGTADIEFDYGPGTYNFLAAASGLAELESYRSTLMISFTGTRAGQPSQWSNTYEMVAIREPAARQMTLATAGDHGDADPEPVYRAELNGVAYERRAEAACTAAAIHEPDSLALRWEPASFLSGVIGAVEARAETVNGVAATRYTFDERAFGSLPSNDSTGEMWVASEGAYLVKYQLSTVGAAEYFGEGTEGTLTLDYQVTEANAEAAIELPADCLQEAVDAPLLPDATDVVRVPGVLSYATASPSAEVATFYQRQLPALGWEPKADATVTKTATVQNFTREGDQLAVVLAALEVGTAVRLLVTPIQKP